jgi:hypothetical protein
MFFLQAAESPVVVRFGEKYIRIPKYTMDEVVNWGAEIMQERIEKAIAEMTPQQSRDFLVLNPPIEPDLGEMKRRLRTPNGTMRVLNHCLPLAEIIDKKKGGKVVGKLTEEDIETILKVNGTGRKAMLAWELADLDDNSLLRDPNKKEDDDDDEDDDKDPLPNGGKRD